MKNKFNIPGMLVGAVIGAVAMLTIAATSSSPTLSYGRFQLVTSEHYIFKIDTSTGQVWRAVVASPAKDFMEPNVPAPKEEPRGTN